MPACGYKKIFLKDLSIPKMGTGPGPGIPVFMKFLYLKIFFPILILTGMKGFETLIHTKNYRIGIRIAIEGTIIFYRIKSRGNLPGFSLDISGQQAKRQGAFHHVFIIA